MGSCLLRIVAAAMAVTLGACSKDGPGPNPSDIAPSTGLRSGRLAFVSDREGSNAIYMAEADKVWRVTAGSAPSLSPDGERIAFNCGPHEASLCIVQANGTGERVLTTLARSPDWSPDGSLIVAAAGYEIVVIPPDGSSRRTILSTRGYESETTVSSPAWSPDGGRIAVVMSTYDFGAGVVVMNADGSNPQPAWGNFRGNCHLPFWSSDGSELACTGETGVQFLIGNQRPVGSRASSATWTNDGDLIYAKAIAYPQKSSRIYINENGRERQLIADLKSTATYADLDPDWVRR